jgi:hypothetical protein
VTPLHLIAEDLADDSLEEWADEGLRALEAYLAKHAAFATFLAAREV